MKHLSLHALVICLVIISNQITFAGAEIRIDNVSPGGGGMVYADCNTRFTFRLEFTGFPGNSITAFTNGFKVWTRFGGVYTDNFTPIRYGLLPTGWQAWFDGGVFMSPIGVDGIGADTVGFGGFSFIGEGLPDGFSDQVWWIETIPTEHGDEICIDKTFFSPGGTWTWNLSEAPGSIAPDWGGPYCYTATILPCGPPEFVNCPPYRVVIPDIPIADTIIATDLISTPGEPFVFNHLWGPGTVQQIDDSIIVWSYTPSQADLCTQKQVAIEVVHECNCAQCIFDFYIIDDSDDSIAFTSGCNDTAEVYAGESASLLITVDSSNNICAPTELYLIGAIRFPQGTWNLDDTGLITFNSDPSDRGHYTLSICLTNSFDTICCPVSFFVRSDVCLNRGNVDGLIGPGGPIDVSDLSYLVDYLFKGGPEPACIEEGNIDGIVGPGGPIDVVDLSGLVDYLFSEYFMPPCP